MELPVLPTTVIGSYPKPRWLNNYYELWENDEISEKEFNEAVKDASAAVIREQEILGIDIPWDGEMGRKEMVEYFAAKIEGFSFPGPVRVWGNFYFDKPSVVGPLEYKEPLVLEEFKFIRSVATRNIVKIPITGPYTIAEWSFNEYYDSKEDLAIKIAKIINKELKHLEKEGATFVQIDEPALSTHPEEIEWAVDTVNRAVRGVHTHIGLHVCYSDYTLLSNYFEECNVDQFALEFANRQFSEVDFLENLGEKEVGVGVIDVHNGKIETPQEVSTYIKKVFDYVHVEKIYINPDCGLKLLSRDIARKKLENMVKGVKIVRKELRKRGKVTIPFENRGGG